MEEDQATAPAPVLLPLDVPRVITLKARSGEFKYKTRRVTLKDWETCFQGIVDQSMRVDGELQKVYDADSALIELADRVMFSADDGAGRSFPKPDVLPFSHRLAIGTALRTVTPTDEDDQICDFATITMAAVWPTAGASVAFGGLVHRFRHPSIEDVKRFRFESARARVRGDGRNSITIYPSRLAIAMKLYDDLIDSVEGYAFAGAELEGKDNVVREMDGAHKATAALQLFIRDGGVDIE